MSFRHQRVERFEQLADIVEMQAGGRLVEDEHDRSLCVLFGEERCEFHALALAARERRRGLPQFNITETHILQSAQFFDDLFVDRVFVLVFAEKFDGHLQNVVNRTVVVLHFEYVVFEPFAATGFAHQLDVGHKLHADLDHPFALTLLAAPARDVERKMRRIHVVVFRIRLVGEKFADFVVRFDVSDRIRA